MDECGERSNPVPAGPNVREVEDQFGEVAAGAAGINRQAHGTTKH